MGVYSTNRNDNLGPVSVVAAEGYYGAIGAAQIMIEACQNDQAFFEAVIHNDFKEAIGVHEGTILESELLAVNEAGFGGFIDKVKELLTKLLEKIKGFVNAFKVKVANVFVRDNKAFVEKYKGEVLKKDLSKMKFKYSQETGKDLTAPSTDFHLSIDSMSGLHTAEDVQKYIDETYGEDKAVEKALGATVGKPSVEVKEYAKEVHEYLFKDEEELEGPSAAFISGIIGSLETAKKIIDQVDKSYKESEKKISDAIKSVEKSRDALVKLIPKQDNGSVAVGDGEASFSNRGERDALNAKLNALYKAAITMQTVFTRFVSADMTEAKFNLAQMRRVFAQAAAFNSKSVKEDATLIEAVGEASDYEVESCFNSYEF